MALVLYRPIFWVVLVILTLILLWLAIRWRLRWFPAWILRIVALALILFIIFSPRGENIQHSIPQPQVLVLDRTDSIPEQIQQRVEDIAKSWQSSSVSNIVVLAGKEVEVISSSENSWPDIGGNESTMKEAIVLSEELLGDRHGRLILASDGLVSGGVEITTVLENLAKMGHEIDILELPTYLNENDLFLGNLLTPTILWENTPFNVTVPIYTPKSGNVNIKLMINGKLYSERSEDVSVGENFQVFDLESHSQEIMAIEAIAEFEGDPRQENNRSFNMVQVFRAPRALFITEKVFAENKLGDTLSQAGINTEVKSPEELPKNFVDFEDYQVVILNDVKAEKLSYEQMVALKVFVKRQGGGLIFIGGHNSYTLGGYDHTILESIMPVILEPAPRDERPPTTFVIIMDRSLSMAGKEPRPIDMAQEAAMRAVETLQSEDFIGVMTFSDEPFWDVPISKVRGGITLREALDTISQIKVSGGTLMYIALEQAVIELDALDLPGSSQVLLLSDGQSADGSAIDFTILSKNADNSGITISTIALGDEADQEILAIIAGQSSGRFYSVLDPTELPRIMITESRAARSENIQSGETRLISRENHPVLSGMSLADFPSISGYNALTSRSNEGAEDIILSASFQDPILSAWQYGLGRVIVWTTDDGMDWTQEWQAWDKLGLFWSQIIRYALLNPALGPTEVNVDVDTTSITAHISIRDELGVPSNLMKPTFTFVNQEQQVITLNVPQVAPGKYSINYPRPPEGAYRAKVTYENGDQLIEVPAFFTVNYPPELKPSEDSLGLAELDEWVKASNGEYITFEDLQSDPIEQVKSSVSMDDVRDKLLLAVIIFWPLEIAIRRRWLPWK